MCEVNIQGNFFKRQLGVMYLVNKYYLNDEKVRLNIFYKSVSPSVKKGVRAVGRIKSTGTYGVRFWNNTKASYER